jgi:sensor c-di-GMP phosphodiesterase-like protein
MQIDRWRVAVVAGAVMGSAVCSTVAWTWHSQQRAVTASAELATQLVDARLDAVAQELNRIAALPELQAPLTGCPANLVHALLQESLHSSLVRRFEVWQEGQALRCGPQGERPAEPWANVRHPGLHLVLGGQIAIKPEVLYILYNGLAIKATLDPHAFLLPDTVWPAGINDGTLRLMASSADAGSLLLWGPRRESAQGAVWLKAQARSAHYQLTLVAELTTPALTAALRQAALAAALSALAVLAGVAWVWRHAVLRSRLVYRLAYALRKRQFEPFVQPIVNLSDGRCLGGEVLMRWKHPQRGMLGPGEFIEEAERTGLILGMSDLTMALAAHRLAPLAQASPDLYFSFNITPGQLRENGFAQRLNEIFRPDTVPRQQVLLELTERDLVDPLAKGRLIALRAEGWRIAIDDFGTGQSSLSTIESLPIDRIKIDRAFVNAIDERTVNRPVLDAIIQLARELQVPLIAEGVETRAQWDYLAARGVASAQGFLMARPMPIADFLLWLQEHSVRPGEGAGQATETVASGAPACSALARNWMSPPQRQLWQRMRAAGGLQIQDRMHKLRSYPACFVGSQAVDWMVATLGVSRGEAVHHGRALVAAGLLWHVVDEHDFKDANLFYCLASQDHAAEVERLPEAAPGKQALLEALDFPWRSHSRGLLRHHHCATGRELVDWIVQRYDTPRHTAQRWAAHWMRQGALRHVFDSQPLRDDHNLYRLG